MNRFTRYLELYIYDSKIRFNIATLVGIIFNAFYIVLNLILGIFYENAWFVTVSVYYLLIAFFRYVLIDGGGSTEVYNDNFHTLAQLMLVLAFPMGGMVVYTVLFGTPRTPPSTVLPIFAIYAFFSLVKAIIGIVFSLKGKSSVRLGAHFVRLSLALMSAFNLQTSLIVFLNTDKALSVKLNFITGGAAVLSIFAIAIEGIRKKGK